MEALLRGQKCSEMIPFSWADPVLYYPIRHHSPACSWHLEQVIRRYQPDCILVEGPENANELIPVLTDPGTKPPIALYYAYRDEGKRLGEWAETYRCYYPFLDQSPELVALRAAADLGIPGKFMDLPYAQILLATKQAHGLRQDVDKQNYASDRYLTENRFQQILCQRAGVRHFEEFWEKYVELPGLSMTDEAFVDLMNRYCLLARQHTPEKALEADGCLAREAYMAQKISEAAKQYPKVLVVAGGFHIWGLIHPQPVSMEKFSEETQSVYPMRYTMPAADALLGYASGMPSPGFYAGLWDALHEKEHPWETVILDHLVKTGRKLRSKGWSISTDDEIHAMRQAVGLAELRDKAAPGLYELQDAVQSCFIKGEATPSGAEPLAVLQTLTTGKAVGQLCAHAKVPPLTRDFELQCKKYHLKRDTAIRQTVTLSIFSNPKHRDASRFLYQTLFLDCGFAQRKKGPDLRQGKDKNLIREIWEYRWTAGVDAALIEHGVSGGTMVDACATELGQRMEAAQRAGEGADLLVQGFLMGIGDVADTLVDRMEALLIADGDFASLCSACSTLYRLEEWQSQYGERGSYDYGGLLGRCFSKVVQMLPAQYNVDDRGVRNVQEACMLIHQVTTRTGFQVQRLALRRAFEQLANHIPIHPALHGTVLGLLYGGDPSWKTEIHRVIGGYLKGTQGMMRLSAAFLQGLFYTARDLLLTDKSFLEQVDSLLCELSDEDFTMLLPELRLAFSYFAPMETDRIAATAAALHGGSKRSLRMEGVDVAVYRAGEIVDAWAAARMEEWREEL